MAHYSTREILRMSEVLDSLWSPEIRPTVRSPFAILDDQARALASQTEGILVGQTRVTRDEDRANTEVHLDIVVPVLNNSRHRILTARHRTDLVYPAWIDADCFRRSGLSLTNHSLAAAAAKMAGGKPPKEPNEAANDEEFRRLVEKVLKSDEVTSLATSLIARVNDVDRQRQQQAENPPEDGDGGE
jgi:hypothetical protein